jgi:hypothetical protein
MPAPRLRSQAIGVAPLVIAPRKRAERIAEAVDERIGALTMQERGEDTAERDAFMIALAIAA